MASQQHIIYKNLSNDFYSKAHGHVFDIHGRIRIAKQIIAVLQDFFKEKKLSSFTCLDLGCSAGIITNFLSSHFKIVVGTDIDEAGVAYAKKHFKKRNLTFQVDDATKMRFKPNTFDIVICQEIYMHLNEPQKMLDEIYRILKPGGICYFVGDNLLFPVERQYYIPFLHYIPDSLAKNALKMLGHKTIYLAHFKTNWQLKNMCHRFTIHDYTLKILKNPEEYNFIKLIKHKKYIDHIPPFILSILYYFLPTYIWILKKTK